MNDEEESESDQEDEFDEEGILRHYFNRGFSHKEMLLFLEKYHDYKISRITLIRRVKSYGLIRRGFVTSENSDQITEAVRERIREIVNGPGQCGGYRTLWHTLEMEGLRVPRIVVQQVLKEVDPDGCEMRKARRLKRREYHNPGHNYSWSIDGYDKLKPFGFPIHGAIDGFSSKILWLQLTRSNNSPDNIGAFYLKAVEEFGGLSVELVTDLGTENGIAAAIQSYFRDNCDAHRYVPSPRNQRIEGWWSFFAKNRSTWWRKFFSDLEIGGFIDLSYELSKECLWYCFSDLLQKDFDGVKQHWNTHRIRRSRYNTIPGRPDALFFLPEQHGGVENILTQVPRNERNYAKEEIVIMDEDNDYKEYFDYVTRTFDLTHPTDWEEALELYNRLIHIAENGE